MIRSLIRLAATPALVPLLCASVEAAALSHGAVGVQAQEQSSPKHLEYVDKSAHVNPLMSNLSSQEKKEWYQQGNWPLIGSIITIVLGNIITVSVVIIQSRRNLEISLKQRKLDRINASLTEFYDPLTALMTVNSEIFEKTGPNSFPTELASREAASLIWNETKQKIIDNNRKIEELIKSKSHHLAPYDRIETYLPLLLHVSMYEIFQTIETDLYLDFRFPIGIVDHLKKMRCRVLKEYRKQAGG